MELVVYRNKNTGKFVCFSEVSSHGSGTVYVYWYDSDINKANTLSMQQIKRTRTNPLNNLKDQNFDPRQHEVLLVDRAVTVETTIKNIMLT